MLWKRRVFIFKLCILSILLLLNTGCQPPAKKPTPDKEIKLEEEPTISLYFHETGETKELKIEEYLEGVVGAEMEPKWPLEALAAQAILARTFTMKKVEEGGLESRGTDASTDIEEFQAYDAARVNEQVKKAVERTRGEIVTYQGEYINSWFHADSGGKTAASAEEGLDFHEEATPYIISVDDPGHEITTEENKAWTASFSQSEVQQAVNQVTGKDPGLVTQVSIQETGPSGRAITFKVNDLTVSAPALRLALGSEQIRSTLLDEISVSDDQITVKGKGFGHGVGLSQWGAKALAEEGKKAEEIVEYFFQDVKIEKRW